MGIGIITGLLGDALLAMLGKIAVGIISERFLSRITVAALRQLEKKDSNEVTAVFVDGVIDSLEQKKLPKVK